MIADIYTVLRLRGNEPAEYLQLRGQWGPERTAIGVTACQAARIAEGLRRDHPVSYVYAIRMIDVERQQWEKV